MDENAQVIRLKEGEKIHVDKSEVGYSINGPATVIVVKEKAAGRTTADEIIGPEQYRRLALD